MQRTYALRVGEEKWGIVRYTTVVTGNYRYFTCCEGSQAIPARPSGKGKLLRSERVLNYSIL
jgi:hypothetical protein